MVGAGKILTVSYGTFSCTLEGFDDPFEAMRGIAEYFRDLAADDRYFGAEPPTPDADMLHRIAENEGQHRVSAQVGENSVVLRQSDQATPALKPAPAEPAPRPAAVVAPATTGETVAQKLARIRDAAAHPQEDFAEEGDNYAPLTQAFVAPEAKAEQNPAKSSTDTAASALQRAFDGPEKDRNDAVRDAAPLDDALVLGEDDLTEEIIPPQQGAFARQEQSFADLIAAENDEADALEAANSPVENDETVTRLLKMRLSDFAATSDEQAARAAELESEVAANLAAVESQPTAASVIMLSPEARIQNKKDTPRTEQVKPEKTSVRRLLDVTNSEMEGSESSRRRSAIAHLKAAVAATRAERSQAEAAGEEVPGSETGPMDAYRDDLARAVRNKSTAETPTRETRRLAPLVLVSEQRIEEDEPVEVEQFGQPNEDDEHENIFAEDSSFAEFARDLGALDLPDMLEAAAAYYHYVEGQPHFSRPQIMSAVATLDKDGAYSREEGLRSFGMLLRRGTIRKVRRGQFEITDESRFRPELQAGE